MNWPNVPGFSIAIALSCLTSLSRCADACSHCGPPHINLRGYPQQAGLAASQKARLLLVLLAQEQSSCCGLARCGASATVLGIKRSWKVHRQNEHPTCRISLTLRCSRPIPENLFLKKFFLGGGSLRTTKIRTTNAACFGSYSTAATQLALLLLTR